MRTVLIAILLLAGGAAAADEIKAPKLSAATVDWNAARAALNEICLLYTSDAADD